MEPYRSRRFPSPEEDARPPRAGLAVIVVFLVAMWLVLKGFRPVGVALAGVAVDAFNALVSAGWHPTAAALTVLGGADIAGLLLAFAGSYAGGVRLPSGLPHVVFDVLVPFSLAVMQAGFFERVTGVRSLAASFGTYNFVLMFAGTIAVVQVAIVLSRRRFETRL